MIGIVRRLVLNCILALSVTLVAANGAFAQCDSTVDAVVFDCSVSGVTTMTISGVILPEAGTISAFEDRLLSVLNSGVLELGPIGDLEQQPLGDRLSLTAGHIDYLGNGARMESNAGYSINAYLNASDTSRFELRDHFAGTGGLAINSYQGADLDIVLAAGEIEVTETGLLVTGDDGEVRIEIAPGTWIDAARPVEINGMASTRVILAGELRNAEGSLLLGNGTSELELRSGYKVEGVADGMEGSNGLVWGGSDDATFDLTRIGSSYLRFQTYEKRGSSTWTLQGDAPLPLGIKVTEGGLLLSGSLDANDTTTVLGDAWLGGGGQFGTIDLWGRLAPGEGVGTLYGGSVIFQDESLLEIEVTAEGGDRLELASAQLSGGTVYVVPRDIPAAGVLTPYVFLETDEVLGEENRFLGSQSASSRFRSELIYGEQSVALTLTPTGKSFAAFARNAAERAIAERLDALGEAAPLYPALDQMTDAELEDMLAQLAGSGLAASAALVSEPGGVLSSAALGRVQQADAALSPAAPLGYAPAVASLLDPQPVSLWGRVVTSLGDTAGSRSGTVMVLAGLDSLVEADWSFGALLGFGGSAQQAGEARSQAASLSAAVYGARPFGAVTTRFVAGATLSAVQSRRAVTGPGVDELYLASYPAFGLHLLAEVAVPLQLGPLGAELFADAGFSGVQTAGYSETGGPAALTVAAGWSQAVDVSAGLRVSHALALGTTLARLDGSLALTQRFAAGSSTLHSFAGSEPFVVVGEGGDGTGLQGGLNLHFDLEGRGLVDLGYSLAWRPNSTMHTLSARFVRPL